MSKPQTTLTPDLIKKVAHLARLELSADEVTAFQPQLGDVLAYVEALQKIDVAGLDPLTHPLDLPTALREDVAREFGTDENGQPRTLASAPDVVASGFKVPQVI